MKLNEALTHRKLLKKRMLKNIEHVSNYASFLSNESLPFGTEEAQRKHILGLIQSQTDLSNEFIDISRRIEFTNRNTALTFNNETRCLSDWLYMRDVLVPNFIIKLYQNLNTNQAERRMSRGQNKDIEGKPVQLRRFYDEAEKLKQLEFWEEFKQNLNERILITNTQTDVMD